MFRFAISSDGGPATVNAIRRFAVTVADWRPTWPGVSDILKKKTASRFATGGRGDSHAAWTALNPDYARRKAKTYPGRGILQATGRLEESLTTRVGTHYERPERMRFEWGTSDKKAGWHQRGTPRMPMRPVVDLSRQDELDILREMQNRIVIEAKTAGLL